MILGLAATVRISAALLIPDQTTYFPDSESYLGAARDLLAGRLIRSDLVMPGYPVLLALLGANSILRLCTDILLSIASVWLLIRLTAAVIGDRVAGLLAGLIWALWPFSIFYALVGYSETLFVVLLLLGFLGYYRGAFGLGSLAMVAAILTRPLVEILAPILIVIFALIIHRQSVGRALRHLVVFAATYVVLMTPWWIHNFAKYGSFVRLDLGFAVVLYAGNNPLNTSGGGEAGVDFDPTRFDAIPDTVARYAAMRDAAVQFIIDNPKRFIELAGLKFLRLWGPASGTRFVAISVLSFLPVVILAIIGFVYLLARRWRNVVPIVLFLGYTTAVHMVTIGSLRYRFPMEPFLVILAAHALSYGLRMPLGEKLRPIASVSS
jgi:4-amino-4-deoxy-L-arabinose transferase-like glycosyltransferase